MYEPMEIIKECFEDNRTVMPLDETMHLFKAEDNTIIYMDLVIEDFTIEKLLYFVEIAEELYEQHNTKIYLYLICPQYLKVLVKEFEIKSEADFTIRLCVMDVNPCNMVLDVIKKKVENNEELTEEDKEALTLLPMVCPHGDQHRIRQEVFKIMNAI